MTLDNLAALAEVIGAVAVVISLVYVGYQVKQNTKAIKTQVHETVVGHVLEAEGALLNNADLAEIMVRTNSDPGSLSPADELRANTYYTFEFVNWESAFLHFHRGFVDKQTWHRWDLSHRPDPASLGQYHYWKQHRHWFEDTFALHIDQVFIDLGFSETSPAAGQVNPAKQISRDPA